MNDALQRIEAKRMIKAITGPAAGQLSKKVMEETFFGIDAYAGVTSSAKMNMIISGDGHTNISCANSLSLAAPLWSIDSPEYDLIISNPPFGTSEADLPADDRAQYSVRTTKGQLLFLTFKPNKISVKSSVVMLERYIPDEDLKSSTT